MGVVKAYDYWIVSKALYGLKDSPRYWEDHRDEKLRTLTVTSQGTKYHMIRSQVHHSIWHLYEHGSKFKAVDPVDLANFATPQLPVARPKPTASMGIYVDGFFYV